MTLSARTVARSVLLACLASCTSAPALDDVVADEARPGFVQGPESLGLVAMDTPSAVPEPESPYCAIDGPTEVPVPDRRLYATWQTFPLNLAEHGVDGSLRVLQDSRFTGGAPRHGTNALLPPCDSLEGRIEVLDARGAVVDVWPTGSQADVTAHSFGPGQTVYQVRSLVQCLASCWCGNHLTFLRVTGGKVSWLEAERASGAVKPVFGVTAGCYEGAEIGRGESGLPEVQIHRTVLLGADAVYVDEHHFFDGSAWRSKITERRRPW
jgi:hypothetical protein